MLIWRDGATWGAAASKHELWGCHRHMCHSPCCASAVSRYDLSAGASPEGRLACAPAGHGRAVGTR